VENLFEEYARLLRQSWCNPSYKPWRMLVHEFEHEHAEDLWGYFGKWQGMSDPEEEEDDE